MFFAPTGPTVSKFAKGVNTRVEWSKAVEKTPTNGYRLAGLRSLPVILR
jgi:hypothetical protein